ncbi:MAG: DUF2177 family protein [Variovorax sp.]|nr:DUF2177 family protein [Variovorax sp.]
MSVRQFFVAYLAAAMTLLALDGVWLTGMGNLLYRPQIGHLMSERFALAPALAFYAIYIGGVVVFAVSPAAVRRRVRLAFWRGAFLGLLAYATYDLTNQATLKQWPWLLTLVDLAWGTFLTALASAAGCRAAMAAASATRGDA